MRSTEARPSSPFSPAPSPAASPWRSGGDLGRFARRHDGVASRATPPPGSFPRRRAPRRSEDRPQYSALDLRCCCANCGATRRLWRLAIVTSIFWLIGAIVMSLLPPLVTQLLHGSEIVVTMHLADLRHRHRRRLGPRRLSAAGRHRAAAGGHRRRARRRRLDRSRPCRCSASSRGRTAARSTPAAYFAQPGALRAAIDLALLALAGGLMIVPSFAAIQALSAPARARAHHRRGQCAQRRLHGAGGALVAGLQAGASRSDALSRRGRVALLAAFWIVKAVVVSTAARPSRRSSFAPSIGSR